MPINTKDAWDFGTWILVLSVAGLNPAGVTLDNPHNLSGCGDLSSKGVNPLLGIISTFGRKTATKSAHKNNSYGKTFYRD